MRKIEIDRTTLTLGILFGPFLLFAMWQGIVGIQDHKLAGIVDYKAGHTQKAIQELQDYLKDHPCTERQSFVTGKPQLAQEYLGLAYLDTHQDQKAVDVLKDPCVRSSNGHYDLGLALMRQNKLQGARAAFAKSIDLCKKYRP